MWKRNSNDPLVQFFVQYGLHLLAHPRQDVAIGDVYPVKDGQTQQPGKIATLIDPPPPLPSIRTGEKMADVSGVTSDTVSMNAGVGFLESFLAALGAMGVQGKLQASLQHSGVAGLRFRFSGATRDYVDPFEFERLLRNHRFDRENSLLKEGYRYYVVLGVARTNQISFSAEGEKSSQASLDVEALQLANAKAGGTSVKKENEEVTVSGDSQLAFGVELNELVINPIKGRLELAIPTADVKARGKKAGHSTIGGPEDDIFLP